MFTIPCVLTIVPGGQSTQNRIALKVSGETIFDDFEQNLTEGQRTVAKQIAEGQAKLLSAWAQS